MRDVEVGQSVQSCCQPGWCVSVHRSISTIKQRAMSRIGRVAYLPHTPRRYIITTRARSNPTQTHTHTLLLRHEPFIDATFSTPAPSLSRFSFLLVVFSGAAVENHPSLLFTYSSSLLQARGRLVTSPTDTLTALLTHFEGSRQTAPIHSVCFEEASAWLAVDFTC